MNGHPLIVGLRRAEGRPWRVLGPLLLLVAALVLPQSAAAQTPPTEEAPAPSRPPSRVIARDPAPAATPAPTGDEAEAGFLSTVPMQINGARGPAAQTGRRIDIDLRDADIHNVLRLLAEVGNVNIVASDDVSGNVTIRMHNVPWDRALEVILAARSLGMQRDGNIIRIAPQSTLDKERELAIERAKQNQQLEPLETRLIPVSYATGANMAPARPRAPVEPRHALGRRAHQRAHRAGHREQPQPGGAARALARHPDAAGAHRGPHRRGDEPVLARPRHPVGRRFHRQRRDGQPHGDHLPSNFSTAGGTSDGNTPTAGLSPTSPRIANPNFAVNMPAAVGTGAGGAIGFALGSIAQNLNLNVRPLGRGELRRPAHRQLAPHPDARQHRGADRPGHAHPLLPGERGRRPDGLPGGEAPAPRAPARDGRRLRLHPRPRDPRRARLQQHRRARRPHRSSSARPRPTCSSRTVGPRSSAASTRATTGRNRGGPARAVGDIPILGAALPAATGRATPAASCSSS
jgi:hypothetical protein